MGFIDWLDSMAKKFKWYDFSVLKLSMLAFAFWLAIVWPDVLSLPKWLYFVVFLIGWLYLLVKMLK